MKEISCLNSFLSWEDEGIRFVLFCSKRSLICFQSWGRLRSYWSHKPSYDVLPPLLAFYLRVCSFGLKCLSARLTIRHLGWRSIVEAQKLSLRMLPIWNGWLLSRLSARIGCMVVRASLPSLGNWCCKRWLDHQEIDMAAASSVRISNTFIGWGVCQALLMFRGNSQRICTSMATVEIP